ncbi:unnamed protein product [Linum tenue]|uniref:Uncharacterized protein n=1 Tax=Linum tenue TaxID=586396 RepID=A0AAV0MZ34_9ROSI|nr:unnamed protein product [Linum tenue]
MSERDGIGLHEDSEAMVTELTGLEITVGETKKRKRGSSMVRRDDCQVAVGERLYKRVLLSLGKPSYVLGLSANSLRPDNRIKLRLILKKLVRQHDWVAASGVLSVLLNGTQKESCPAANRFKYWVFMKLVQHMEGDYLNATSIDRVFSAWMSRIGSNGSHRRRSGPMEEDRIAVQLESILLHFREGDVEGELNNATSLVQEYKFESYPMFNMIIGMIFYQLWYSSISEDMQLEDSNQMYCTIPSDMEAYHPNSVVASGFVSDIGGSEGCNSVFSDDANVSLKCGSETSIMQHKQVFAGNGMNLDEEKIHTEDDVNQFSKSYPGDFQHRGLYANSADEVSSDHHGEFGLPILGNLDLWLRPLQADDSELDKVIRDGQYNEAVKYLSRAASSTPPILAALLPLVQLLLIRYDCKEALDMLENFCDNSSASLPHRLKSCILERIDPNNAVLLSRCYEDTLKSDPTCNQSLAKLVSLHHQGIYDSASLLEMIALHLEAATGEKTTWKELALCFLRASQQEEDQLSGIHGNGSEVPKQHSISFPRVPSFLINGVSGKSWRLRCRWWMNKHFSKSMLASEINAGDAQIVAYKAACASHMYGSEAKYAVEAFCYVCKQSDRESILFLKEHMRKAIGLNQTFSGKNLKK